MGMLLENEQPIVVVERYNSAMLQYIFILLDTHFLVNYLT